MQFAPPLSVKLISPARYLLPALVICLLLHPARAQQTRQYEGAFEKGDLTGHMRYSYKLDRKDTLFHGPFELRGSDLKKIAARPVLVFSLTGQFENGEATKDWEIRHGRVVPTGEAELADHHYRLKVSGEESLLKGRMERGKFQGSWNIWLWNLQNSELADTLLKALFSYEKGLPQGDFNISADQWHLQGRFNEKGEGVAAGVWVLTDSLGQTAEQWQFEDGLLQDIVITANGTTDTLPVFPGDEGEAALLEMARPYFELVDLYLKIQAENDHKRLATGNIFLQSRGYIQRADSALSTLSGESAASPFRAPVRRFPYNRQEQEALEEISGNLSRANEIAGKVQTDAQLNILKLSDERVAFNLLAAAAIQQQYLHPADSLLRRHRTGILEYLPRQEYVKLLFPEEPGGEVKLPATDEEGGRQVYKLPDTLVFRDFKPGLAGAAQFSEAGLQALEDIRTQLQNLVKTRQRERELVLLEDSLMRQYQSVLSTLDSISEQAEVGSPELWNALQGLANTRMREYSAMEEDARKAQNAQELMQCFRDIRELTEGLSDLPRQQGSLEQAYTRQVWNPYTYTYMSETIKKRILNAYRERLVPYLLDQLAAEPTCEKMARYPEYFDELHKRMIELRTTDTDRIERKLKRQKNPEAIFRLFNLEVPQ